MTKQLLTPRFVLLAALALLAACSNDSAEDAEVSTDAEQATAAETDSAPVASEPAGDSASDSPTGADTTLALEGLGDLTVGQRVPSGSSFAARGAQVSDACTILSSPDYPSVYAMVTEGVVKRITVSEGSPVRLVEGIGPGSTEAEVTAAFPGFVASDHKYVAAPAKYLKQPGGDARLMFEMGSDGRVQHVHVGMEPELSWVEGCA